MLILINGKDNYRSRECLKETINRYQGEQLYLAARIFDATDLKISELKEELGKISMFKGKQLIVLTGVFSSKSLKEEIMSYRQIIKFSDTIVFFEEEAVKKSEPLFSLIKKLGEVKEFDLLDKKDLAVWIRNRIKRNFGLTTISEKAINLLIYLVGANLWRMAGEVDKLANFKTGGVIEEADVRLLVKDETGNIIFETIDQVALQNAKTAYQLIHKHIDRGESPFYLLSMIAYQFRNLLIIKSLVEEGKPYYSFNKLSGLHPFVIKKGIDLAQKFTLEELKKIYQKIFKADFDIKRGRVEPITAIDLLVSDICLSRKTIAYSRGG